MSFATRSAIFAVPLVLALLAPAHDVVAAEPLLRARLDLNGLASYMKDRAPKEHAQIAMVRAMGLSEVRIAILPDDDRMIVPVVSVSGNKAVLRNLLTAKESPVAKVLVSKGENRFQLQYGTEDTPQTLDLTLTEHGDSPVLSLPGIDAATRTAAIARTTLLEQGRDRFIEFEFDVPEDLELGGLRTVFDKYGVSKEPMARMALMSVGMMLGQMLEPFQSIDRLAGGVFVHSAGLNIVDVALAFTESEVATTTHAMLLKKQLAPRRFRGIVELTNDKRLRSKLALTNKTLSARYGWSSADELELAKLLEQAMRAVTKREMVANEGTLASTPHEQRPLAFPIDTDAWQKKLLRQ